MARRRRNRAEREELAKQMEAESQEPSALQFASGMLAAGLVVLALLVMRKERWTLTLLDGVFWGAAAAFLVVRQVALTMEKEKRPSGVRLLRALVALSVATALWVVAQAIGSEAS